MRVLVTGANGQLGHDLLNDLKNLKIDCLGIDIADGDITNKSFVLKIVLEYIPNIIIHCAAYTRVDDAEEESDLCYRVNTLATKYLLDAANNINAKFIFISTDYVFDGTKEGLYEVFDTRNPLSVYGKTKMEAEDFVLGYAKSFIVRTSWVYGINGANFVKTMLRLSKVNNIIHVVEDQIGSPTYTKDLSKALIALMKTTKYGIYHITNEGFISWYEFCKIIFEEEGINTSVKPIPSDEYITKATRPKNSRLSKKSLDENGFSRLPSIFDALKRYLKELK